MSAPTVTAPEAVEAFEIIKKSLLSDPERLQRYKQKFHEVGNTAAFYAWAMQGSTAEALCQRFKVQHTEADLKALWAALHVHADDPKVHAIKEELKNLLSS
eukprot:TRINITY_DN27972_c0_g1_i1.p1 TRINITY_DN27972_c0_g1~~TRINITY_DN27972_c0_g1_i1.p1  ORF type:complete len:101 (-),score=25.05 TRINITY_DN27972_c0_g1_i1:152-454(-)